MYKHILRQKENITAEVMNLKNLSTTMVTGYFRQTAAPRANKETTSAKKPVEEKRIVQKLKH